jgi:hypothetical protein
MSPTRTVAQALAKLKKLGITLDLPTPPNKSEGMLRIERESEERMAKSKAHADKMIAQMEQHRADLLAQSKLHTKLLREERMEQRRQDDRVVLAARQGGRKFSTDIGAPWSLSDRQQWLDEVLEECASETDPDARRLHAWLDDVERREGIDGRLCVEPRIVNGAAVRSARYVEWSGRRTVRQGLIRAHEDGHILHQELKDYHRVPVAGQVGTISVPAEIAAWGWVHAETPVWTEPMHDDMTRFLGGYRMHANEAEAAAIDRLCSPLTLRIIRQRIVEASL